jgi:outer membrane protein OmpA-like peptidoglycan-associated protein
VYTLFRLFPGMIFFCTVTSSKQQGGSMRWACLLFCFVMAFPAWAGEGFFAADKESILEGLTGGSKMSSRGLQPSGTVRALRVRPGTGASETVTVDVDATAPSVRMRIEFDTGSDVLRPSAKPLLHELGAALRDPLLLDKTIRIAGHTDSDGDAGFNLDLSLRRAERVAEWLTTNEQIDPHFLEVMGFGEGVPLVENAGPASKQKNRRVEISISTLGFEKEGLDSTYGQEQTQPGKKMAW